jgi:hypothetical protein
MGWIVYCDTVQWKGTMPLGRRVVDKEVEVDFILYPSSWLKLFVCIREAMKILRQLQN